MTADGAPSLVAGLVQVKCSAALAMHNRVPAQPAQPSLLKLTCPPPMSTWSKMGDSAALLMGAALLYSFNTSNVCGGALRNRVGRVREWRGSQMRWGIDEGMMG